MTDLKPENVNEWVGYFESPYQSDAAPSHDPGLRALCPICQKTLTTACRDIKTISLMKAAGERSYFFRAHKTCWDSAPTEERDAVEHAVLSIGNAAAPNAKKAAQPGD